MKKIPIAILGIVVFLFASCGTNNSDPIHQKTSKAAHSSDHWGYTGAESPEHWSELSSEYWKCAEGHFQSPIDIESYTTQEKPAHLLDFNYHPSPIDLVNNGHTVQANPEEENAIEFNNHGYALQQIHFHEPSEHQIDGIIYPMEMHMVHADSAGKLAVVGIFIKEGQENSELALLWNNLPEHPQEHIHPQGRYDLLHFLPDNKALFHYTGSLTTPPCSEGVEWLVLKHPITLSKQQIEHFRKLYHGNNRPVQQQYAREVEAITN